MHQELKKTLQRERFKHTLFPTLLFLVENLETWEARAAALNAAGLTTFHGKPWTRGNVHKAFHSYWTENNGQYSWNLHQQQLEQLEHLNQVAA